MSDSEKKAAEIGTNGGINGVADDEVVLMTEEELEKAKMRPADIDQDMKEMERRKRVENIMNSALFREELERIIETQIQEGYTGYQTLQNISEMIGIPSSRTSMLRGSQSVIPINDIRGMESLNFAKGEKLIRCKLASIYRLIDIHGWTQSIYNHCTARVSQDTEHFLLNPFGMLYHEVTAASLIKVDMQGNVLDPGSTNFGVNIAGFLLHSAIHASRPDIKCIIHLHHPAVVAVSAFKDGLLPLSQESLLLGDISYHDYCGIFVNPEEKDKLSRSLGPINKVMFLRNHGVVCCGETVEETWYNTYHTVLACETQMRMAPMGFENLIFVSDEARQLAYDTAHRGGGGGVDSKQEGGPKERKLRIGDLEFEALMRTLDNGGLRTGYIYRRPLVKSEPARLLSDVALPPAASNYTHLFDEDDLTRSPLKRILDGRKAQDKSRWLNSPNTYSKVEVLETGTPDPKKITKWVADDSPTHATSVKLEDNLMFVPKYTDPKEFKRIQKMIKENRRIGNISAGPTSHLLEGVTWEEARRMQDATMSSTGDHVILVGAASKGIIQREFQHNAVVYKTPYSKNPFDAISDQELEDYKQTIERKQRGEPEEIEIEQMNITPQVATRDIVDDANQVTSPMSPLSDDDAVSSAHQLQFETKMAPRASKAQSVIVSDEDDSEEEPIKADVTRVSVVELQIPHFIHTPPVTYQNSAAQQQNKPTTLAQSTEEQKSCPVLFQDNGFVTYITAGLGYVTYDTSDGDHIYGNEQQLFEIDGEKQILPLEAEIIPHQNETKPLPSHKALAMPLKLEPEPLHYQIAIDSDPYQYEGMLLQHHLESESLFCHVKSEQLPHKSGKEPIPRQLGLTQHQSAEPLKDQLEVKQLSHKLTKGQIQNQLRSLPLKDPPELESLPHHLKSESLSHKATEETMPQHLIAVPLKGQLEVESLPNNLARDSMSHHIRAEPLPRFCNSEVLDLEIRPSSTHLEIVTLLSPQESECLHQVKPEPLPQQSDSDPLSLQPKFQECPVKQLNYQVTESYPHTEQISTVQPRDELISLMLTQLNQPSVPSSEPSTKYNSKRSETESSNKKVTLRSFRKQQRGLRKVFDEHRGDALANGEETEAHQSTLSHSSKEGSPTKDTSLTDDSISKDKKKKKKGLRTPSFLKKKKDKKKEKEAALQS